MNFNILRYERWVSKQTIVFCKQNQTFRHPPDLSRKRFGSSFLWFDVWGGYRKKGKQMTSCIGLFLNDQVPRIASIASWRIFPQRSVNNWQLISTVYSPRPPAMRYHHEVAQSGRTRLARLPDGGAPPSSYQSSGHSVLLLSSWLMLIAGLLRLEPQSAGFPGVIAD